MRSAADEIAYLVTAIKLYRYSWSNEVELQDGIEMALAEDGLVYEREHQLSPGSRVDFFVSDIALEVKVAGSRAGVLRQLHRYAEHDAVKGVLLVTPSLRLATPPTLCEKPASVCRIPRLM